MCQEPVPCGQYQPGLFAGSDACRRTAKLLAGAQAYLDEYRGSAILTDQVDLAAANAIVAFEDFEFVSNKKTGSDFFRCPSFFSCLPGELLRHQGSDVA